ncbi:MULTISPECIES: TonB-dependent receptor plug domain-containing protein [unclassified Sphingomonas]|uniref:TonB-dependent receptor plug domain-containing protein n=1 Tax=unclassified Sphingomonas TaxID=196159 RepID=UPI0006F89B5A|nr:MULTISPECIES: TonB-dependent receptor [unclassified Sphingomonas]KQM26385.1 TonB-dependent receptor [Sphingomonas sp. Leaf9]KQM42794.1 TonB-dependent receptor [Sphingomonas sp. Leaf11]
MKTRFLLLPCLLAATPAFAQSAQSTSGLERVAAGDDEIVVTANREARPVDTVGQAVTVLDIVTIEQRQAVVVSDLLRQTPGVTVTRNGGPGTTTSVNIRGGDSDQTVALIDGVKLNDPSSPGGGFNFGNLLIGNIARIEVLRGAQSVLWGSQAIGGVVNMITRQPTEALAINARAEGGSFGTGQAVANVSGKAGPVSASIGGGFFTTDGISAYAPGREKDGYRNYGANGSVSVALADSVSVDVRGFYSNGRTEIDGFPAPTFSFGDTREVGKAEQWTGYTGLNAALFDGRFRNRIGYAHTQSNRTNNDPDGTPTETFRGKGRNDRTDYQGSFDVTDAVFATFGVEREVSRFTTASFGGPATTGRARLLGVYGQLAVTLVRNLTLTGGVRHDDHNVFGGATVFSGSGVWSPNGGNTLLRASYSEGFKAPTLYQLQSEYGNAQLTPERSKGWDAGITQRGLDGAVEASATWFDRTSKDLIAFISCPANGTGICADRPFGTYDNIQRAEAKGLEFALKLKPVEAFTVAAAYTWLDAENRSVGTANFGRKLARRPANSMTVNADYRWAFGLSTGATVTMIGDSFDNASNARRLDGYVLTDLRAAFPVTERVEVYGRVENLFDERYQTIFQYGTPGRAAYGGVRVRY